MLKAMSIQNVALIEQLNIGFHRGLNVLTGETGAGKSIVVDAVNLILGARAEKSLIRHGSDKACVEAAFDLPEDHPARERMIREEIDPGDQEVILYREISMTGKNACRMNGVLVSLSVFREIAELLMNIHGQNDHLFLMHPEQQLGFLDRMGDQEHQKLLAAVSDDYDRFIVAHRQYAKLIRMEKTRDARTAEIEQRLKRLGQADPARADEKELRDQVAAQKKLEKNASLLRNAHDMLLGDEDGGGCLDQVKSAGRLLQTAAEDSADLQGLADRCTAAAYELEDITFQISRLLDDQDLSPATLAEMEERLAALGEIRQRYGSLEAAAEAEEQLRQELEILETLDERIRSAGAEHKKRLAEYRKTAEKLSRSRHQIAERFEIQLKAELTDLGMANTRFQVCFLLNETGKPQMPTALGNDQIEFQMSANPGEPLKPLAQIASGGELSRIMLAVKALESSASGIDSMVFDEIDTGISGLMAQAVAKKMIVISRHHQVICVTHLPQLAAAADYQYLVYKQTAGSRTRTDVRELDPDGRVQEIARIVSGAEGPDQKASEYACSLLDSARKMKEE